MSGSAPQAVVTRSRGTAPRVRLIVFRGLATLAGLFFVVAVVLMASAPWVLLQPDGLARTEPKRWFLTVAGSVDAISASVLLALAHRPRRTLLIAELSAAVVVAGAIMLPFQPTFAAILAVGIIPLIAYPYWRDIRAFPSWWTGVSPVALVLPLHTASWGRIGGAIAVVVGVGFGAGTWRGVRGSPTRVNGLRSGTTPRRGAPPKAVTL